MGIEVASYTDAWVETTAGAWTCSKPRLVASRVDARGETASQRRACLARTRKRVASLAGAREVVVAPNGLALDKDEKEHQQRVMSQIDFSRSGRGPRA